jgi:hypothetical protein
VNVVPRSLGKVSAAPATAKVALGKEVDVTVRVARIFETPTSFKVEPIIPANIKGVSAKEVTIEAGENEAKMRFTIAPDAAIGPAAITLRFTGTFNEVPVVHETKLTIAITK